MLHICINVRAQFAFNKWFQKEFGKKSHVLKNGVEVPERLRTWSIRLKHFTATFSCRPRCLWYKCSVTIGPVAVKWVGRLWGYRILSTKGIP